MDRENMPRTGLTREQKTGFVLLLVFGVLTVSLAGLQMRNTIYGPFVIHAEDKAAPVVLDENARLQSIDTDQDGINDYEELNFYGTSPYLADTDSDGTPDKVEIDRGTDPLCAEGKQCTTGDETPATTSTVQTLIQVDPGALTGIVGSVGQQVSDTSTAAALLGDTAALRRLLLQSGKVTEKDLAGVDDATLKAMAADVLNSISNKDNPASP